MDQKTTVVSSLRVKTFLDICSGSGAFSHYTLKTKPNSKGIGIDILENKGQSLVSKSEKRYRFSLVDIVNQKAPLKSQHDVVYLNGWNEDTPVKPEDVKGHEHQNKLIMLAQLLIAFEHLGIGGNLIMKMGAKESLFYASIIQAMDEQFERTQLVKPTTSGDEDRSYFYFIGFSLQSNEYAAHIRKLLDEARTGSPVKIFQRDAKDLIDNYGKALLTKFTPLWETQYATLVKKFGLEEVVEPPPSPSQPSVTGTQFVYKSDLDTNGIIYHLNGGNCRNPDSGITVTASSVGVGEPVDFITRDKARCWTQNQPYSWYLVDFGEARKIIPTHYTLGYGSPGSACCPQFWLLQGSNKLTRDVPTYGSKPDDIPQNDPDWRTLAVHNNDRSLFAEWAIHSWKLNCRQPYRYFRVIQTGPNSFNTSGGEDSWSQVLVLNRFEIYGTLLPADAPQLSTFKSPPVYPLSALLSLLMCQILWLCFNNTIRASLSNTSRSTANERAARDYNFVDEATKRGQG